jgi:hypothetical protein
MTGANLPTRDAVQPDQIPEVVLKTRGQTAFDVNAGGRVLYKEIGRWNVVRDYSTDLYGIATSRLFWAELPHLIGMR